MATTPFQLESSRDRDAERRVSSLIEEQWGCIAHHSPTFDGWDFVLERDGRTRALVEMKNRYALSTDYSDYFLAFSKLTKLLWATEGMGEGVVPIFIWAWQDRVDWIDVRDVDLNRHGVVGRRDRGYEHDRELCAFVDPSTTRRLA